MEMIHVTPENLDTEHICCALSDKKGEHAVSDKKAWLKERMEEGLVFLKMQVRGKAFIEYLPIEKAWTPIEGDGYMHINCLWVSGQFKGQGYSNLLLEACIEDALKKGKTGLSVLSSKKKRGYLSDPKYLAYKGFQIADEAHPDYLLYYYPFDEKALKPKFLDHVKATSIKQKELSIYYTDQCPFASKYAEILAEIAKDRKVSLALHKITSLQEAKQAPCPSTSFALYDQGEFVTNEILSEKKFIAYLETHGY